MNHLVIYSHPNPASFNHAILETYMKTLKDQKQDIILRDLYTVNFQPVLRPSDFIAIQKGSVEKDVAEEQKQIQWADILTFIFPVWWTGMPALLKGYIDRVFSFGFAYKIDEKGIHGLLTGKKAIILNTTGTPQVHYESVGMFNSLKQTFDQGIMNFCGIEVLKHDYFCGVTTNTDAERKSMLVKVAEIARSV